jgi:hypothetical protein
MEQEKVEEVLDVYSSAEPRDFFVTFIWLFLIILFAIAAKSGSIEIQVG